MGPFKVLARTAPNTYRLDVPGTWRTSTEFNVKCLQQYLRSPDHLGGEAAPPPQVIDANGRPEHEVQELLKFKMLWGRTYVQARWVGHDASGDRWGQLDNRLRGGRRRLRAGHWLLSAAAAAAGLRRRAAADSAGRFHSGPRATCPSRRRLASFVRRSWGG